MSKNSEACITAAGKSIATIPAEYKDLHIKNCIPNEQDWDAFNKALCECLNSKGCAIAESELDDFWQNNNTFGEMIDYIDKQCGYKT